MKSYRQRLLPALLICATLVLAGCESSEERAERHYQSAVALLEEGDADRALVELRNVFKLNEEHRDARLIYARLQRERNELGAAYAHYLKLVEVYPDDIEGRRALAEIAFEAREWDEAERHTEAGIKLAPEDPSLKTLDAVLDYRQAAQDKDPAGQAEAIARLRTMLDEDPANLTARRLVIGDLMAGDDPLLALPDIEAALAVDENDFPLQVLKLQLLVMRGEDDITEAHLKEMLRIFPDDQSVQGTLVKWFVDHGRAGEAETLMRQLAEGAEEAGPRLNVVTFLRRMKGDEAALAELDRLIEAHPGANIYRSVKAAIYFEAGQHEQALGDFADILENAEPSDEARDIRVAYARALDATGGRDAAKTQIDTVLAEDSSHVGALKLQARWQIGDDRPDDAILTLRRALDQAPRDAEILTLMAEAHTRAGSHELAGERLSLAVEMSNRAPAETLRYARFLLRDDRPLVAETVLIDALRLNPDHLLLLGLLGDIYLQIKDWPRAQGVLDKLRRLGGEDSEASRMADRMQARLLLRRNETDETIAFLEALVARGDDGTRALAALVRTHVTAGNIDEAARILDEALAETPDAPVLRLLRAGVYISNGETDQGEAIYRALIAENPQNSFAAQALARLLGDTDRAEEAETVLEQAAEANPENLALQVARARRLEGQGRTEEAIAVYEALYEDNNDNLVLANNLASLLSTHRDSAEDLERAYAIARRLRGTEFAPFQDTYGWIAYRRGDFEEALRYLEPAAKALTGDPLVRLHLGMTYAALKRNDAARAALTRALEMAGDSPLPQYQAARETLDALPQVPAEGASE